MAHSQSKNLSSKNKNPIAKDLRTRKYRAQVIKNKKIYNRKKIKEYS